MSLKCYHSFRDIEREGEIREIERERGERDREVKGIERVKGSQF